MRGYRALKRKINLSVPYKYRFKLFSVLPNQLNTRFWISSQEFQNLYDTKPIFIEFKKIVGELKEGLVPYLHQKKISNLNPVRLHKSIDEVINKKFSWNQLSQYRLMSSQLLAGGRPYNCKNENEIEMHLKNLVCNIKKIYKNGIKERSDWNGLYPNNILVTQLSDNKFALEKGGTHRYTIAALIQQEKIPVNVIRHISEYKEELIEINNLYLKK